MHFDSWKTWILSPRLKCNPLLINPSTVESRRIPRSFRYTKFSLAVSNLSYVTKVRHCWTLEERCFTIGAFGLQIKRSKPLFVSFWLDTANDLP